MDELYGSYALDAHDPVAKMRVPMRTTEERNDFLQKLRMAASEADDMLSSCDASDLLDCLEVSRDYMFDAAFVIQQLEEQLATLNEQFESMHQDFKKMSAEDEFACNYCKKAFGKCHGNCEDEFEWRGIQDT